MIMKFSAIGLTALLLSKLSLAQDALKPLTVVGSSDDESALDTDDLELLQIVKTKNLHGQLPGFTSVASDSAGYGDFIGVRGTGNTSFFGPAGVGFMIDDVPFSDVFTYATDFYDLASLQLHRGPQGAFFGRNGAAGLLQLRTLGLADDAPNQFSVAGGSYNEVDLRLRHSKQVSDTVGLSLQTYYNERDGFIDNSNLGSDVDGRNRFGFLGNVYLNHSSDAQMKLRFLYERVRDGGQRISPLPQLTNPLIGPNPIPNPNYTGSPFGVNSNILGETDLDRFQLSFHYDRDFGWASLQSITAFQRWDLGPQRVDLDFSPLSIADSSIGQAQNYWTQEFRLGSEGDAFSWNSGVFLSYKDGDGSATRGLPIDQMNPFAGQFFQTTNFDREEKTFALYGNATWALSNELDVTAGARLQSVETEMTRSKDILGVGTVGSLTGSTSDWYFSPTLGLSYDLSNEVTVFARSSIGIKPAGYAAYTDDPTTFAFEDETAWENEIGVRHELNNAVFELRGYHKQIDDYQLNRSVDGTTDFIIVNADEVEALGVEAELTWQPIEQLSLFATAGWNETSFDAGAFDGNQVPFVPDFTASVGFDYNFGNGFFVAGSARFIGDTFYDENESALFQQSSYNVVDAQIGYETEDWSLVLYGRNLLDEDYYSFVNSQIFAGTPGDPTVVGLRYERRF